MATYSGTFGYTSNSLSNGDGDETGFFVGIQGAVTANISADSNGFLSGNITGNTSANAAATGEEDGDIDGFNDAGNNSSGQVSGTTASVDLTWSFGTNGQATFQGSMSADQSQISGTVTVYDGGSTFNTSLVLTSSGPPGLSTQLAPIAQAISEASTRGADTLDKTIFATELVSLFQSSGSTLSEFTALLKNPELEEIGNAGLALNIVTGYADFTNYVAQGDSARAFAAVAADLTELGAAFGTDDFIEASAGVLLIDPPAGAIGIALGLAAKGVQAIDSEAIDTALKNFFYQLVGGTGTFSIEAIARALQTAASSGGIQLSLPAGTPIAVFDPGYYLANHSDAVAGVASGAYSSAYDYYLMVGIGRGDVPSAGASPVNPASIPNLTALQSYLNPHTANYSGIFDLAVGALPTDGLSTIEKTVGTSIFGAPAVFDTSLTAMANRLAIDMAWNQHLSGVSENLGINNTASLVLSNGAAIQALEAAAAPNFNNFSVYIVASAPNESIATIEAELQLDIAQDGRTAATSTAYGIAEFAGVWVAVVADSNTGTTAQAAPSEASGSASISYYGPNGNSTFSFGAHDGTAYLGAGDDTTCLGSGNDTVVGGSGHNTIVFQGASSQYTLTPTGDGVSLTASSLGPNGTVTDHLSNVNFLQFSDKTMVVADASLADVALLYQGALGRTPDTAGLIYWENIYQTLPASVQAMGAYGLSDVSAGYNGNLSVAAGFTNSAEFIAKYGTLTNQQFVTNLYANVLDRAPDTAGFNYWMNALSSGQSREHVLVGFADSAEAISNATLGFTGQSGNHAPWLLVV